MIITAALVPILLTILLGYGIKKAKMLSQEFWLGAETLTYYVLAPALLISILSNRSLSDVPWLNFLVAVIICILISALALILYQRFAKSFSPATFTSVFQGGVRFNTFIALALVNSLYGDEGLRYAALATTAMIILVNILSVSVFAIYLGNQEIKLPNILKQLVINPLIIGVAIGITLNVTGIGLHSILVDSLDLFGRAAFPIGLMLVGSALSFKGLLHFWETTLVSSCVQFIVKPITAFVCIFALDIAGTPALVLLIFFSIPTAPSAYILARKLDGDAPAIASIITNQTLLSFISLPIILYFAGLYIH